MAKTTLTTRVNEPKINDYESSKSSLNDSNSFFDRHPMLAFYGAAVLTSAAVIGITECIHRFYGK